MKVNFLPLALFCAFFLASPSANAQLNVTYPEKIVALAPLTYDQSTASPEAAEKFWHFIFDALFNTKRFKVVDRLDGYKSIVVERKLQTGGEFIDGKVVKQSKVQGATLIVFGHVMAAQGVEMKQTNGTVTYNADLSLALKIIEVETGEILATVMVTPSGTSRMDDVIKPNNSIITKIFGGSNNCYGQNPQQALEKCMGDIDKYVRQFVRENFPVEMRIFQMRRAENDKYNEYMLTGAGPDGTFKPKDKLSVQRTELIPSGGKNLKFVNEVVQLEVVRNAGDFLVCKVVKSFLEKEAKLADYLKTEPQAIKVVEFKSN
jgi:curli biogenesis system outer membrane secretion channel CsgG